MHPEHKLVDEIINKYKFKGWLTNRQVTNELQVKIVRGTNKSDSYNIFIRDINHFTLVFSTTIFYLQKHYFIDVLNPTNNELVLFELDRGFEWPLQDKFRLTNLSYNHI